MKKRLKISLLFCIILVLLGSLTVFVIIPVIGKNKLLHLPHKEQHLFPHDVAMIYENVTITTTDGLELKGWFVDPKNSSHPNSNITLIVLHGVAHSKARMLDYYGEGFYDLGYRILYFDSRNRGESPDTELGITWGIDEVKDVKAAVDFVRAQPEVNDSQVVLFGISQGAATMLFYTAHYNDVSAIIADSSWSYGDAMIKQAFPVWTGFPWRVFGQITIAKMENHFGFTFADISPAVNATTITTPCYIIHGLDDFEINPDSLDDIIEALPENTTKLYWEVPNRAHVESYLEPNYFTNIADFISDLF